jgi:hypothetical protein
VNPVTKLKRDDSPKLLGDYILLRHLRTLAPHIFPTANTLKSAAREDGGSLAPFLVRIGRERFISRTDLDAWMQSRKGK